MNEKVFSKEVIEFITVAKEYCNILDNLKEENADDFLSKIHKISSLLYLKGSILELPEEIFEVETDRFVTEEMYASTLIALQKLLGNKDLNILVDPYTTDVEKENEWLYISEIFTDIYQSLCDFLNIYRTGNEEMMNDALYELVLDFREWWGAKLLAVLFVIHKLLYTNDYDDIVENNIFGDRDLNTENWFTERRRKDMFEDDEQ